MIRRGNRIILSEGYDDDGWFKGDENLLEETDPIEATAEYMAIEKELEKEIIAEIGKGGYMGYCHLYWGAKKRILKEKYGIEWKSPAERNPHVCYD